MQKEYQGHTITVTEDMQFEVSGPLYSEDRYAHTRTFNSYAAAQEAIDKRQQQAKVAAREKLSLPVYTAEGAEKTITGVHARNCNALGVGDTPTLYPRMPFLGALLLRQQNLGAELENIYSRLRAYQINPKPWSARSVENAIDMINKDWTVKTELAKKKQAELDAEKEGFAA